MGGFLHLLQILGRSLSENLFIVMSWSESQYHHTLLAFYTSTELGRNFILFLSKLLSNWPNQCPMLYLQNSSEEVIKILIFKNFHTGTFTETKLSHFLRTFLFESVFEFFLSPPPPKKKTYEDDDCLLPVVGFKIKTTSPEKYRVRPSSGVLQPGWLFFSSVADPDSFYLDPGFWWPNIDQKK